MSISAPSCNTAVDMKSLHIRMDALELKFDRLESNISSQLSIIRETLFLMKAENNQALCNEEYQDPKISRELSETLEEELSFAPSYDQHQWQETADASEQEQNTLTPKFETSQGPYFCAQTIAKL